MNEEIVQLIQHLGKFTSGTDVSVQWAKDAEGILDRLGNWDNVLDELQEYLARYRPEGGPQLCDRCQMDKFCKHIIPILKKRVKSDESAN